MYKIKEETILNVLDKKIKDTQTPSQSKKKNRQTEEQIIEEVAERPKFLDAFATNYQKLVKQFNLLDKKAEHDEDMETRREFDAWASKLGCQKLSLTESKVVFNPSKHFEFDPEDFIKKNLFENSEEPQAKSDLVVKKYTGQVPSKFELKLQDDLDQGHKEIFKKMLDDVHFETLQYRTPMSSIKLRTDQFIFEYNFRIRNGFNEGKISFASDILALSDDLKEEVTLNNELQGILTTGIDLCILDYESTLVEEYSTTILYYITAYVKYFENLRAVNNEKLAKPESEEEAQLYKCNGYVRPRVLILVSYRHEVISLVTKLFDLSESQMKANVGERLENEFASEESAFEDNFIIGISFNNGKVQITTSLIHSDILISTTAHVMALESDSILSSIEILYIHKLNDLAMQNFHNLAPTFSRLNKIPDHKHCTEDFRTIRDVFSNGLAPFVRQTIVYSEYTSLEINSLLNKNLMNYKGLLKSKQFYPAVFKAVRYPSIEYTFKKVEIESLKTEFEEKFNYFKNQVWDRERKDEIFEGSLLVVNDYLQYKQLKRYFKEKSSPVGFISEHSPKSKVQGVFAKFNIRKHKYILITERALFFQITEPKKFEGLIFIGLPYNLRIFENLLEELLVAKKPKMIVVFSKKDSYELEKIIGTAKTVQFVMEKNRFKMLDV